MSVTFTEHHWSLYFKILLSEGLLSFFGLKTGWRRLKLRLPAHWVTDSCQEKFMLSDFFEVLFKFEKGWRHKSCCVIILELRCCRVTFKCFTRFALFLFQTEETKDSRHSGGDAFAFCHNAIHLHTQVPLVHILQAKFFTWKGESCRYSRITGWRFDTFSRMKSQNCKQEKKTSWMETHTHMMGGVGRWERSKGEEVPLFGLSPTLGDFRTKPCLLQVQTCSGSV